MRRFVPEAELKARARVEVTSVAKLDDLKFSLDVPLIYSIGGEPLPYDVFLRPAGPQRPLLVFGQGAQNRDEMELPRFQRLDWAEHLPYNVLIFSDPTLYLSSDLRLGWGIGTHDHYVLPNFVKIVTFARDSLGIANENIVFYGSSAGGFTSLMLGARFAGSSALVNNPQTNVLAFKRGGLRQLLTLGFGGLSEIEAAKRYGSRFSVEEALLSGDLSPPRTYYLQNILDEDHMADQLLPYVAGLQRISRRDGAVDHSERLLIELYADATALHNPIGLSKIRRCLELMQTWFERGTAPPAVTIPRA